MLRDYSLTGASTRQATESGLAPVKWYRTPLSREQLRSFTQKSDGPAIRDTVIWLGLLVAFGAAGAVLWPSWASVPFFLAYGVLYGSASDSRWHECGHGTAFRTRWMNDWVYQMASFMIMRNPTVWRWSHQRHHTDTYIVGRDPEINAPRPPKFWKLVANFFGLIDAPLYFAATFRYAFGNVNAAERTYIPEPRIRAVCREARIHLAIYAATIALAVGLHSIVPLLLVGLPRLYGGWHMVMVGMIQHSGLADNVSDHRLNTRTCYMNPISRFVYWNMNYHVEHHMFTTVPFHRLADLHREIGRDLPAPTPSIAAAFREIIPVLWRQRTEPDFQIVRTLPEPAGVQSPSIPG